MTKTYIKLLAWFLHHANRQSKDEKFYYIKNRILKKYGRNVGYKIQFIEGIRCNSCGGSGVHKHYSWTTNEVIDYDACWHCFNGWYKRPVWNILQRFELGNYEFLQPYERVFEKPSLDLPTFDGYAEHKHTKYGEFALLVLFMCCEKGYLKRWYKELYSWRMKWWLPRNWFHNFAYIIKFGRTGRYPLWQNWRTRLQYKYHKLRKTIPMLDTNDDLPF